MSRGIEDSKVERAVMMTKSLCNLMSRNLEMITGADYVSCICNRTLCEELIDFRRVKKSHVEIFEELGKLFNEILATKGEISQISAPIKR